MVNAKSRSRFQQGRQGFISYSSCPSQTICYLSSVMRFACHHFFVGGEGVLVWGSGSYRRSNVYLAYVPLDSIENRSALLYFAGTLPDSNIPFWVPDESQARPLFLSGSAGELCVRWNSFLEKFVMLYNSDNPPFILERQSTTPWGPWSGHQNIFDWDAAIGHYIHQANSNDGLGDDDQPNSEGGGVYGPYLISRYTRSNQDQTTTMFFVLSVHNPYNTMLMSAVVRAR
jgi:Domain of unknown function (DUF4185)